MSLADLGRNDISEETRAFKDRLASRDTECAGLRTQLMRREAELEELRATLNESVYKLSKEAERALQLEEEVSAQSSELKMERISLRNTELALKSTQDKLKAEERARKELESTLDTVSLHSQTTTAEHQSVQREKRALESRVRELERIVQTHEARRVSNIPHKGGRPRSSSVSNFRLPAVEQELNDTKAQLHSKEMSLRTLEQKLAKAQDDLVMAENARISIDKAGQKRISELLSTLERKEGELESLRETDHAGEREEGLLRRIDEDAAKIAALETLVAESQANRSSQARIQKLQSQLRAECEKVHHSEDLRSRLLLEKEELMSQYEASQREIHEGRAILVSRESQIRDLEVRHAHLLAETSSSKRTDKVPAFSNESALADHIQTLLQAIDRLRDERNGLKRALEFSQVEYRITTEGFQSRVASLTTQLTERAHAMAMDKSPVNAGVEQRMKQLTLRAAAFCVVISNLQTRLDLSEDRLSATTTDLASSKSRLHDALALIDNQNHLLVTNTHEHDIVLHRLDATAKELSASNEERDHLHLRLADIQGHVADMEERVKATDTSMEEAHQRSLLTEERFATLNKEYQDMESERNSLVLHIANLQDGVTRLQDELVDAQNRYNTLHAQQLSAMSTSQAGQALTDRIQELEARIAHQIDEIDEYQHDIRRLEANVKLHEERIAEVTPELELLVSQKVVMVEDCAAARDARDEAIRRLEAAEEEAERLQLLNKELNAALSHSRSLEQDSSRENTELQEAIVAFAVVHRSHRDGAQRLQKSHQHITVLELQLVSLRQDLARNGAHVDRLEKENHELLQRLSDICATTDESQENHDVDSLRSVLEEKERELATTKQLLEETQHRYAAAEAQLLARIATITSDIQAQAQARPAEDITNLREELENVRAHLQNSLENFADLEKRHDDVIQEFATLKEDFERRLIETDEQIRTLDADHERSLLTMEAKYRNDTDILARKLEDRDQEMEELRQEFKDLSEAHIRTEGKLREEMKSYEDRQTLAEDVEKDLRGTITDMRQRLTQAEAETLALQEERQSLQGEITGVQAEIQRSSSLTRYLEGQIRERKEACILLKERLQQLELSLAESEKASKVAEFNLALQTTQQEKVVAALRREIASLQSGPELRSTVAGLQEKNREMDDLLRGKCQEIEEYDDRILETLKANKKLMTKIESLTRKVQTLQGKLSSMKSQPQESVADVVPPKSISSNPPIPVSATSHAISFPSSVHQRESSAPSATLRTKTPEPRTDSRPPQPVIVPPSSRTPGRMSELSCEISAGKKRPAPDDDERDGVPAEGHYSTDVFVQSGPTQRLRRGHGHPAGFTPVRGASSRKPAGTSSPGRRLNAGAPPSDIITDVTNSPRGSARQGESQPKKKGWLGKIRGGAGAQPVSSRLGTFGGQ